VHTAGSTDGVLVVLGPAAAAMRRRLGPLAWCALEALHERASVTEHGLIAAVSVSALADELGVAKNTAHRAVKTLRGAGLLEHAQARAPAGRFDISSYSLATPDDVLTRCPLQPSPSARSARGSRSGAGRRAVAAPAVGGFDEQLALLPLA
jgi:hypothetical protein